MWKKNTKFKTDLITSFILLLAWNNKTIDKTLTLECQETLSKLTSAYRGIR